MWLKRKPMIFLNSNSFLVFSLTCTRKCCILLPSPQVPGYCMQLPAELSLTLWSGFPFKLLIIAAQNIETFLITSRFLCLTACFFFRLPVNNSVKIPEMYLYLLKLDLNIHEKKASIKLLSGDQHSLPFIF